MLMHSAELRWFFDGAPPADVLRWMSDEPLCGPEERRTDHYLVLPGCDIVGVKLRNKSLEIKALTSPPRPVSISAEIEGLTDSWIKWSLQAPAVADLGAALKAADKVMAVSKTRRIIKYAIESGAPWPVPVEAHPTEGCNLELTAIAIGASKAWSIGLEAFGFPQTIETNLQRTVADHFQRRPAPCALTLAASKSYPAWLAGR